MKVDENKNQKLPRKLRKIIVEKKRRERIDSALKQIKDMLFGTSELQNDYMKMEKADILENVVKYLQTQPTKSEGTSGSPHTNYSKGYTQCVREVTRLMTHLCGGNSQITQSLTHYLNLKVHEIHTAKLPTDHHQQHHQTRAPHDYLGHFKSEESMRQPPTQQPGYMHSPYASTIPNEDNRVPPFHTSPTSAFHRVPCATATKVRGTTPTTSTTDSISIAVYQYNHYNNFKNEKTRLNAESNINIQPTTTHNASTSSERMSDSFSDTESVPVKSNITIHPVVKTENKANDNVFDQQNTGMWRPW